MNRLILALGLVLASCSAPARTAGPAARSSSALSADTRFGFSAENPVVVGGVPEERGPANERAYLDRLRGPNGEPVKYERKGSCCAFETPNGIYNRGLLDMYEVSYEGLTEPVVLYINMYDAPPQEQSAPEGLVLAL